MRSRGGGERGREEKRQKREDGGGVGKREKKTENGRKIEKMEKVNERTLFLCYKHYFESADDGLFFISRFSIEDL